MSGNWRIWSGPFTLHKVKGEEAGQWLNQKVQTDVDVQPGEVLPELELPAARGAIIDGRPLNFY
ncbi:MAG: hypothetical protein R3B90_15015 [Planctomycetaceae bacterium]